MKKNKFAPQSHLLKSKKDCLMQSYRSYVVRELFYIKENTSSNAWCITRVFDAEIGRINVPKNEIRQIRLAQNKI